MDNDWVLCEGKEMSKYYWVYFALLSLGWYILYINSDTEIERYGRLIISQIFLAAMGIILAIESKK